MSRVKIIYEDNHLIAALKPAGVLTQGDKTGDVSLFDEIKKYLKEKYKKPGNVFLGLLHRIDRPVSGIVLFAKTSKGASRLSEQFRNRKIEKTYHAIVLGKPKNNKGVLTNNLIKDKKLKKSRASFAYQFGRIGKSYLYYEVIKSNDKYSLLKIKIDTGKFHQIRAQLSAAGFSILGDVKYPPAGRQVAGKWHNLRAIALCATKLSFMSATGEKRINLKIGLPEEWHRYLNF